MVRAKEHGPCGREAPPLTVRWTLSHGSTATVRCKGTHETKQSTHGGVITQGKFSCVVHTRVTRASRAFNNGGGVAHTACYTHMGHTAHDAAYVCSNTEAAGGTKHLSQ